MTRGEGVPISGFPPGAGKKGMWITPACGCILVWGSVLGRGQAVVSREGGPAGAKVCLEKVAGRYLAGGKIEIIPAGLEASPLIV